MARSFHVLLTLSAVHCSFSFAEASSPEPLLGHYAIQAERLRLFDALTDPRSYDRRIRPAGLRGIDPVTVDVSLGVSVIGGLDSQTTEFSALTVFQLRWTDSRLQYNNTDLAPLDAEEWGRDRIWVPTIVALNDKQSSKIVVPKENAFVSVSPSGSVTYRYRAMLRVYCAANVSEFPFDEHACRLHLESWGVRDIDVTLRWSTPDSALCGQIVVDPEFRPMEYSLKSVTTSCASQGGRLYVTFVLRREWAHYVIDFYTPAVLLVALSWVSFWLDPSQIAARVTLGSNAMLSFITLSRTLSSAIPKVAYVNSMDVYSMVCLGFIFGSLVELAIVNSVWRRRHCVKSEKINLRCVLHSVTKNRRDSSCLAPVNDPLRQSDGLSMKPESFNGLLNGRAATRCTGSPEKSARTQVYPGENKRDTSVAHFANTQQAKEDNKKNFLPQEIAKWIDERCRFAFPVAFLAANALYWSLIWA